MAQTARIAALLVACVPLFAADSGLRDWLLRLANRQLEVRRQAVASIATRDQAVARAQAIRRMLLDMIGGLPARRSPLNLRRSLAVTREDYRVEKLIYESQPGIYVTANAYIPTNRTGPMPAVLQPVGHSVAAKARAFYQTLSIGLVRHGFVVLTYDPLGQGERRLYFDSKLGDSKVGGTTIEHQMLGLQSVLAGESIAREMIWDGMRSIDVLQSLPGVDSTRIGVAGCSGGGTLTSYIAVLDDRVKVAAPACYITDWESQLAGTGPQDAEQQFPDQFVRGLNHGDFAIAFAPRPWLQVNTEEDFFPIEGAKRTFQESRRVYALYGAADRVEMAVGPGGHGMPVNVREAIYGWMAQWLGDRPPGPLKEPPVQTEYEHMLLCTPTGQVSTSMSGAEAADILLSRYVGKLQPRSSADRATDPKTARDRLRAAIGRLTRFEKPASETVEPAGAPEPRQGYAVQPFTLIAPGGREVGALLAMPDKPERQPVLLLGEAGARAALSGGSDGERLASLGHPVLALDLAGFSGLGPPWSGYSGGWFGPEKVAWLAMMTGKPLVGLGIEDILAAVNLLARRGLLGGGLIAIAKGGPAVPLLHTAALDDRIVHVVLEEGLLSYESVLRSGIHRGVASVIVPGVVGAYDLPDLAASMAGRTLTLINARRPTGATASPQEVNAAFNYTGAAFQRANRGRFRIGFRREGESIDAACPDLQ